MVATNETLEAQIEAWNSQLSSVILPNTIILVLYLVTGILGNGITILVYQRRIKLTDERFFIPILAVFDLLGSVLCSSFVILQNQRQVTYRNTHICKSSVFINTFFTMISVSLLTIIAVQRYMKFFRPRSSQMTKLRICTVLSVSFVFSLSLSIPPTFFYETVDIRNVKLNLTGKRCDRIQDGENTGLIIHGVLIAISLISIISLLVFVYSKIGYKIFMHFQNTKTSSYPRKTSEEINTDVTAVEETGETTSDGNYSNGKISGQGNNTNNQKQIDKRSVKLKYRLTLMFMVITILFVVCFVPPVILLMIERQDDAFWENLPDSTIVGLKFIHQLYIVNNVINPVVYAFMDTKFREECKQVFVCI